MMHSIEITDEAKLDVREAQRWYEEKQRGLGKQFVSVLTMRINSLQNPLVEHPRAFDDAHKLLVMQFPYLIYYRRDFQRKVVVVFAVLHQRQNQIVAEDRP